MRPDQRVAMDELDRILDRLGDGPLPRSRNGTAPVDESMAKTARRVHELYALGGPSEPDEGFVARLGTGLMEQSAISRQPSVTKPQVATWGSTYQVLPGLRGIPVGRAQSRRDFVGSAPDFNPVARPRRAGGHSSSLDSGRRWAVGVFATAAAVVMVVAVVFAIGWLAGSSDGDGGVADGGISAPTTESPTVVVTVVEVIAPVVGSIAEVIVPVTVPTAEAMGPVIEAPAGVVEPVTAPVTCLVPTRSPHPPTATPEARSMATPTQALETSCLVPTRVPNKPTPTSTPKADGEATSQGEVGVAVPGTAVEAWSIVPTATIDPDTFYQWSPPVFEPTHQVASEVGAVNLREEPSMSAQIVTTLDERTPLMDLGELVPSSDPGDAGTSWMLVRTENGIEGWIKGIFTVPYDPTGRTAPTPITQPVPYEECTVGPRSPSVEELITGTPAAGVLPTPQAAREVQYGELPRGSMADDETIAIVRATVRKLVSCLNSESLSLNRIDSLYTDDFLRRATVVGFVPGENPEGPSSSYTTDHGLDWFGPDAPMPQVAEVWILPDGRIAAIVQPVGRPAMVFIFVTREAGRWLLVDEVGYLTEGEAATAPATVDSTATVTR